MFGKRKGGSDAAFSFACNITHRDSYPSHDWLEKAEDGSYPFVSWGTILRATLAFCIVTTGLTPGNDSMIRT
jgi:hypothetical protein